MTGRSVLTPRLPTAASSLFGSGPKWCATRTTGRSSMFASCAIIRANSTSRTSYAKPRKRPSRRMWPRRGSLPPPAMTCASRCRRFPCSSPCCPTGTIRRKIRALIKRIEELASAVETLLNGLLEVSKLEAGLVVPVPAAFRVSSLLTRLANEFEPLIAEAGLELRVVPCQAAIRSDPVLLERILRNLLHQCRSLHQQRTHPGRLSKARPIRPHRGLGHRHRYTARPDQGHLCEFHQFDNSGRDRRQGLRPGTGHRRKTGETPRAPHRRIIGNRRRGRCLPSRCRWPTRLVSETSPNSWPWASIAGAPPSWSLKIEPDVLDGLRMYSRVGGLRWWRRAIVARPCVACRRSTRCRISSWRTTGCPGSNRNPSHQPRLRAPEGSSPAIILTGDTAPERLRQANDSGHGLLHKPVQPARLRQMIDERLARSPPKVRTAASA